MVYFSIISPLSYYQYFSFVSTHLNFYKYCLQLIIFDFILFIKGPSVHCEILFAIASANNLVNTVHLI